MADPTNQNANAPAAPQRQDPTKNTGFVSPAASEQNAAQAAARTSTALNPEKGNPNQDQAVSPRRSSVISNPTPVASDDPDIVAAQEAERAKEKEDELPEATRAEMDAGRAALERQTARRAPAPTNPVDDLDARQRREADERKA